MRSGGESVRVSYKVRRQGGEMERRTSATGFHGEHHVDGFIAGRVSGSDIGNESPLYFALSASIVVGL